MSNHRCGQTNVFTPGSVKKPVHLMLGVKGGVTSKNQQPGCVSTVSWSSYRNLVPLFQTSICVKIQPRILPASALEGADSDEAGVLEELDEDLVDKLVLGDGLNHQHPLSPQLRQHGRHLHWLWRERRTVRQ